MTEIVLISIAAYLFIGAFLTGIFFSKSGSIQFASLLYMMLLWPFMGVALFGALLRMLHEHFMPKG